MPTSGSPHLQKCNESEYKVWVEGEECCVFHGPDEAVLAFVLAHSVLNCSFEKKYRGMGALFSVTFWISTTGSYRSCSSSFVWAMA